MASSSSRVVVTGATGNVGSVLVARLVSEGYDVIGVARRPPEQAEPGVDWVALDLTTDAALPYLHNALAGADAVVHLAWGFQPSHHLDHLEELGVGGTRRVLEVAAAQRVGHVVHMSSVGTYSPRTSAAPVDETYPRAGVPGSPYSQHKARAEQLLDTFEALESGTTTVTRLRPGIVSHREAGSALLRYAVPGLVPAALLRHLPLLPLDGRLEVPVVHVEDLVDAVARALDRRAGGAFNLAAAEPMTADLLARAFSARRVPVPARLLRGAVDAAWRLRLLQLDPGWVDLAYAVPLLDTTRARAELGWAPRVGGTEAVEELVEGLVTAASGGTPVLRPRTVLDNVRRAVAAAPVGHRRRP